MLEILGFSLLAFAVGTAIGFAAGHARGAEATRQRYARLARFATYTAFFDKLAEDNGAVRGADGELHPGPRVGRPE